MYLASVPPQNCVKAALIHYNFDVLIAIIVPERVLFLFKVSSLLLQGQFFVHNPWLFFYWCHVVSQSETKTGHCFCFFFSWELSQTVYQPVSFAPNTKTLFNPPPNWILCVSHLNPYSTWIEWQLLTNPLLCRLLYKQSPKDKQMPSF